MAGWVGATVLAAPAGAASVPPAVTLTDPLEGQPQVPDLGTMTASIRADDVLEVRTQVVARPPAGWGGCVPLASGLCLQADMSVTWFLDTRVGGSPADGGADSKVVATPAWGKTTWSFHSWNAGTARWMDALVPPPGVTDAGGVTWSVPLPWVGLRLGQTTGSLGLRAVSRVVPVDSLGQAQTAIVDETATLLVPLVAPESAPASVPPPAGAPSIPGLGTDTAWLKAQAARCTRATARVRQLDRRVRRAARTAKRSGPAARRRAARRELRRLRMQRNAALAVKRRVCAKASQPPAR
jgi:hypothetical protein